MPLRIWINKNLQWAYLLSIRSEGAVFFFVSLIGLWVGDLLLFETWIENPVGVGFGICICDLSVDAVLEVFSIGPFKHKVLLGISSAKGTSWVRFLFSNAVFWQTLDGRQVSSLARAVKNILLAAATTFSSEDRSKVMANEPSYSSRSFFPFKEERKVAPISAERASKEPPRSWSVMVFVCLFFFEDSKLILGWWFWLVGPP